MAEGGAIASVLGGVIEPQPGLYFVPVRHHSPACAWAVRALIREVKPKLVLIEAPDDFTPHIDLLAQAGTKPPVAIVALVNEGKSHRVAAYYPFCVHAPEYVAVREARAVGAEARFIDLPAASKAMLRAGDDTTPISLNDEAVFDSGDFVRSLCRRTGCRDG